MSTHKDQFNYSTYRGSKVTERVRTITEYDGSIKIEPSYTIDGLIPRFTDRGKMEQSFDELLEQLAENEEE